MAVVPRVAGSQLGLAVESGAGEQPAKGLLLRVGMLRELLGSGPRVMKTGLSHVWEVILSFFLDCWSPLGFRRSVLLPAFPSTRAGVEGPVFSSVTPVLGEEGQSLQKQHAL